MLSKEEDLLSLEKKQLQALKTLLQDIEQSRDIAVSNVIQVYAPLPQGAYNITSLQKKESPIFLEQAKVIKKILQHPNCPENLSFEITLTNNYDTYASDNNRTRTPLAPIFEALASGKCGARGLSIKLVGDANHVLSSEMDVLVKGLKDGKCPNNLQITFGTLDIFVRDPYASSQTNAWALMNALQSPKCPSGLRIQHTARDIGEWIDDESQQRFNDLARLCTNGNYDRENIKKNIDGINAAINKELSQELSRLGDRDPARQAALQSLQATTATICQQAKTHIETCDSNSTWEWKDSLRQALGTEIKSSLDSSKFDKNYTTFEKLAKNLLNLITAMISPLAAIKYAATGSAFFSTVGKSNEAVEKTFTISQTLK